MGPTGPQGEMGPTGEAGINGKDGTSVTILGSYDTYQELITAHPQGETGNSYLVQGDLYVWSKENGQWINVGTIRGPMGPQGLQGETGPMGPQGLQGPKGDAGPAGSLNILASLFMTTKANYPSGLEIEPLDNLPLELEAYNTNDIYLSSQNDTITFLKSGTYFISFLVSARLKDNLTSNIMAIGLKKLTDTTIYISSSIVGNTNNASLLIGYGIINASQTDWFALQNIGSSSLIIEGVNNLNSLSSSTYANPIVSVYIQKLKD